MKRKMSNEVRLGMIILLIVLAIGADATVRMLRPGGPAKPEKPEVMAAAPAPQASAKPQNPTSELDSGSPSPSVKDTLAVGMQAPDFELEDDKGEKRKLSHYRDHRTILTFYCGCSRCAMMNGLLQGMRPLVGDEIPNYVAVTTMDVEALPSWKKNTNFDGVLLKANRYGPVVKKYNGHPCPRVYVLDGDHKIRHVSPVPDVVRPAEEILDPIATALGSQWRYKTHSSSVQ